MSRRLSFNTVYLQNLRIDQVLLIELLDFFADNPSGYAKLNNI